MSSSSLVQQQAQRAIVEQLGRDLGVNLNNDPPPLVLRGCRIELDGATADHSVVVEAFARQGQLKGGQVKKIAQDILKLAFLKQHEEYTRTRTIIAFASVEAHASISGWLLVATAEFGVELRVVEIPERLRLDIAAAQSRQNMVNVEAVADDIDLETKGMPS